MHDAYTAYIDRDMRLVHRLKNPDGRMRVLGSLRSRSVDDLVCYIARQQPVWQLDDITENADIGTQTNNKDPITDNTNNQ
jgi:hypothetical protein